jgi:Replication-relaxation
MTAPGAQVRVSTARLRQLAADLTPRYTAPLTHLGRARLLTGGQLDRLLAEPDLSAQTIARVRRRIMNRLRDARLVTVFDRPIGGVRAGSAGLIYTLTPAGQAFLAIHAGQPRPARTYTPANVGGAFLTHALAVSEIYVQLTQRSTPQAELAVFATEPRSWHPDGTGGWLRPDAYIALDAPTHADTWWIEVDQDTESLPRLRTKIRTYVDYLRHGGTGPHGGIPRVLFTAPTPQRCQAIRDVIADLTSDDECLFDVQLHAAAGAWLITMLSAQSPQEGARPHISVPPPRKPPVAVKRTP